MMSSTTIRQLVLLLLLAVVSTSTASSSKSKASIRADFVRAMNEATQRKEEESRQQSLMKRMLQNAKLVKSAFTTRTHQQQQHRRDEERKLNNNNNNWNYGYYNYYQQDDYYQQQEQGNQEMGDDAFAMYGGLNLTQYALKYLGCQNIHSFSDDLAADNDIDGVLAMNRFVVFRLCPKEQCSNYNQYGCDYNYGEYTIPMEDYLVTMQEYHIQQYQTFCQTCHSCMTGTGDFAPGDDDDANQANNRDRDLAYSGGGQYYYYNRNGNYYQNNYGGYNQDNNNNYNNNQNNNNQYQDNGNGDDYVGGDDHYQQNDDFYAAADDDGNANNNDDGNGNYYADPYYNYDAYPNDDMFANDDGNSTEYVYQCIYEDVCASYQEACETDMFTDDQYMSYSENYANYFECAEFNVGDVVSYLGPHCRSDGFTIGIGIYEDQYCSSYIGDMVDMQEVTGQEFDDEYLSPYYPNQCISCRASESYDLFTDDEMQREYEENGGLYQVCGYLYDQAAKCNRYLGEDETYEGQYQQEANEYEVCNFVASLVENNYDEYGEAVLENPSWELAKWKEINGFRQDLAERTSPGQILGLIFSIGLVVILLVYIGYLRLKLSRRLPWTRGFGASKEAAKAGQVARVGSGITMQRSLSNLEPGYSNSGSFA